MPEPTPDTQTADDSAPDDPTTTDLERAWVELFATVWRDVDWGQYDRTRTSRTEIFGEKLISAEKKQTPEQVIDELCRRFGLAASNLSTDSFATLRADPGQAVKILRKNRVYLAAATRNTIDAYYDALNTDDEQEAEPDSQTTDLSDFVDI